VKARTCCVVALATGLSFSSLVVSAVADDGWCGEAAWFEGGGLTASGEVNEADSLSAAHPSLPFGTRIKVDNLGNGRSVLVRINDRGSFTRGRVILGSRAAAEELDIIDDGTAHVRLSVVDGDQLRSGRCGDEIAEEEVAPEPPAIEDRAAVEPPQPEMSAASESAVEATELSASPAIEAAVLSESPAREVLPASDGAIAARFIVAFQPETWQEEEFAKVIAAFAPRLAALRRSRPPRPAIPWPALDGMTPIQLTPTLIAYTWSGELSLPDPAGFLRAASPARLTQLTQ
jgi:rare lipoprotein A